MSRVLIRALCTNYIALSIGPFVVEKLVVPSSVKYEQKPAQPRGSTDQLRMLASCKGV